MKRPKRKQSKFTAEQIAAIHRKPVEEIRRYIANEGLTEPITTNELYRLMDNNFREWHGLGKLPELLNNTQSQRKKQDLTH